MNISIDLPPDLAEFVRQQVVEGEYETPAQLIEALLRRAKHTVDARLGALLSEGIESGPTIEVSSAFWKERKRRLDRVGRAPR